MANWSWLAPINLPPGLSIGTIEILFLNLHDAIGRFFEEGGKKSLGIETN